ncbi:MULTISPECIES: fumarate reductase (quinol) flavoprotein subunit [Halorhodospira]|uniref:fumarate reductase (quinol) flavoprotein subunit n=1 Tax=Halorhodospira TaxID=85108 RepID=UPI001A90FF0C|nr:MULTISPECIES: fumarate reductase (quinol) flavoprotein subunit [Halorhodospira]MBK5943769.1 fumarate reductase (quinol) flavoprotein subunit [Halorhodospira halophila]MCG5540483.1 fumarate reductase (quinol) flavoprotein subunit [Halorhodospira sp. M39old]MCG5545021.1 fumarate reductase (quinol) flavoprotein subunit [Halorhodospira sp. M38]
MQAIEDIECDLVVVGGGGAGLRAAIAAAERDPGLRIALISKVVPMRSHTVAAEGGAAGVARADDSLDGHFNDTVSGGDWLCDQDVVERFVAECTGEMVRLEQWGCPWSRQADGQVHVRFFGGMTTQRSWYAADKTGFHMLHTLFQTSLRYPGIQRYDEYFCSDLLVDDGVVCGVLALEIASGKPVRFGAPAVVLATGGAGRVYGQNTNAGIVTGEGMAMAHAQGVPLRDMEFVQWHPTTLPGSGILITEGCRGEGGVLTNRDDRRYLQDYGLGPTEPWPRPKAMELGPRDRLSQAFWYEDQAGRTVPTPQGTAVQLDLRHLGEDRILERLPMITEVARRYAGVDPVREPIPVRPAVHYTMGGIPTDVRGAAPLSGLFAAGECASTGIHGANRLGSNSLAELLVFGRAAGEAAAEYAREAPRRPQRVVEQLATEALAPRLELLRNDRGERLATLRADLNRAMEQGVGIFRNEAGLEQACTTLAALRERLRRGIRLDDRSRTYNTEWLTAMEFGASLQVAEAMAWSARARKESRGAHVRDDAYSERDDERYLVHTLAYPGDGTGPVIDHAPVTVTRSAPRRRAYGAEGEAQA